jgi:hypothetical protein
MVISNYPLNPNVALEIAARNAQTGFCLPMILSKTTPMASIRKT